MGVHILLVGIRERLLWAQKHIALLNKEIAAFVESGAYSIAVEFQEDPPRYEAKAMLKEQRAFDRTLSLVLGDIVHNLRSILDHLAWVLVLVSGNNPSDTHPRTQFPLYTDRLTDKGTLRDVTIHPGINDQARAIVEWAQPYTRSDDPTRHPLSILNELSNIDKHRWVQLTAGKFAMARVTLRRKSDGLVLVQQERTETVDFYTTVATFPAIGMPPPNEVEVDSDFTPLVTLDMPSKLERLELAGLVNEMELYVRTVAQMAAERCFGSPLF